MNVFKNKNVGKIKKTLQKRKKRALNKKNVKTRFSSMFNTTLLSNA